MVPSYLQLAGLRFPACVVGQEGLDADAALRLRLVQALLRRQVTRPWVKAEMDNLLPGAGRAGLQALFRLLSAGVVEVLEAPGTALPTDLAGLHDDLQALAASGRTGLVLLDADGFVLVHAGLLPGQAERWALAALRGEADLPRQRLALQLGRRSPELLAERLPEPGHPAWLRLCSRLARGCGH